MEGLTGLFSNPMFSKLLQGGVLGAGEVGNILEERKRLQYQNFVMDLLKHPEKLAAMAAKIQQPLNNGLVQAVDNRVQGDMASRGLSQAPGIFAASESQALAPYVQQNQNEAMNAVLQSLGMPAGSFQQPQNLSGIMSLFSQPLKAGSGGASTTPASTSSGLSWMDPITGQDLQS